MTESTFWAELNEKFYADVAAYNYKVHIQLNAMIMLKLNHVHKLLGLGTILYTYINMREEMQCRQKQQQQQQRHIQIICSRLKL